MSCQVIQRTVHCFWSLARKCIFESKTVFDLQIISLFVIKHFLFESKMNFCFSDLFTDLSCLPILTLLLTLFWYCLFIYIKILKKLPLKNEQNNKVKNFPVKRWNQNFEFFIWQTGFKNDPCNDFFHNLGPIFQTFFVDENS